MSGEINFLAVALAVFAQFVLGAFWYGPMLFGKQWMKFNDCEDLSKAELEKMQKTMTPFYGLQLAVTITTTVVLALFIQALPMLSPFAIAGLVWLGFVVPTQISSVIWGKDEMKYFLSKLSIMAANSFVSLMLSALILSFLS